jgi:hypothetical protein
MVIAESWAFDGIVRAAFAVAPSPTPTPSTSSGGGWGLALQVVVPIVTLILGALLGVWFTVYLTRPMLRVTGSGGGGGASGPGYYTNYASITNSPGLMGISIKPTVLFGKRVHGRLEKGLTVTRNPAEECIANIHDKETGEFIAPLWWRSVDDPDRVVRTVSIKTGEAISLMLFARLNSEPLRYFIYASSGGFTNVQAPVDEVKFRDTKKFSVRISYSYGRQKLEFDVTVRKGYDGRLSWEAVGGGGGSF